jgi:hypothetical protein
MSKEIKLKNGKITVDRTDESLDKASEANTEEMSLQDFLIHLSRTEKEVHEAQKGQHQQDDTSTGKRV